MKLTRTTHSHRTPRLTTSMAALAVAATLTGCTLAEEAPSSSASTSTSEVRGIAGITAAKAMADNAVPDVGDTSYDASSAVSVALSGTTATADSDAVSVDGGTVTISQPGTYLLSGELLGQVVVASAGEGEVKIVLSGASIISDTGSALFFTEADEAVVILADGTDNTLSSAAMFTDAESADAATAALFSRADLTIGGSGLLTVTAPSLDGITSTDGLVILQGTITVDAADDGIHGQDHLVVTGGTITVRSGGDAVKSDNDSEAENGYIQITDGALTLTAAGDGLIAYTDVIVTGGTLTVTAGGGASGQIADDVSAKALEAGANLVIEGGTLTLDAADDALHSNSIIAINDGAVTAATGDDAAHAEGTLTIAGGQVTITESTEGLEAAVIDIHGGATEVTSSDDGVNVSDGTSQGGGRGEVTDGMLTISGGSLTVVAEGDGLDSNGSAEITGGTVTVYGPTSDGNGALDVNGVFEVSGGTLLAVGSGGMAETPESSSVQGWVQASASGQAGSTIRVLDGSTVIAEYTAMKSFANVVFASHAITSGSTYTVEVDGTAQTAEAGTPTEGRMGGGGGGMRGPRG